MEIQLVNGTDKLVDATATKGSPGYPFVTLQTRFVPDKDTEGGSDLVCDTPWSVDEKSNHTVATSRPVLVRKALAIAFMTFWPKWACF